MIIPTICKDIEMFQTTNQFKFPESILGKSSRSSPAIILPLIVTSVGRVLHFGVRTREGTLYFTLPSDATNGTGCHWGSRLTVYPSMYPCISSNAHTHGKQWKPNRTWRQFSSAYLHAYLRRYTHVDISSKYTYYIYRLTHMHMVNI